MERGPGLPNSRATEAQNGQQAAAAPARVLGFGPVLWGLSAGHVLPGCTSLATLRIPSCSLDDPTTAYHSSYHSLSCGVIRAPAIPQQYHRRCRA